MLIYLIVFIISIVNTRLAEIAKHAFSRFFFSMCAVFPLILLAALRDTGIGTDTLGYVQETWNKVIVSDGNLFSLMKDYQNEMYENIEAGFLFISWLSFLFGNDIHWLYFFTSLFIILPVYYSFYNNRKEMPMWLGMTIFLLLYYNISLNMIRQSISMSFCLFSLKYIRHKDFLKLSVAFVIIINMHGSGVFQLAFVMFYYIIYVMSRQSKVRKIFVALIYTVIPLVFASFDLIIIQGVALGVLPMRYLYYSTENTDDGALNTATFITYVLLFMAFFRVYLFLKKKYRQADGRQMRMVSFCIHTKLFGIILYSLSLISQWANRIAFYFVFPCDCIFLPEALVLVKKKSKILYSALVICIVSLCLFAWYWLNVVKGQNETFPYKSKILGI